MVFFQFLVVEVIESNRWPKETILGKKNGSTSTIFKDLLLSDVQYVFLNNVFSSLRDGAWIQIFIQYITMIVKSDRN